MLPCFLFSKSSAGDKFLPSFIPSFLLSFTGKQCWSYLIQGHEKLEIGRLNWAGSNGPNKSAEIAIYHVAKIV